MGTMYDMSRATAVRAKMALAAIGLARSRRPGLRIKSDEQGRGSEAFEHVQNAKEGDGPHSVQRGFSFLVDDSKETSIGKTFVA